MSLVQTADSRSLADSGTDVKGKTIPGEAGVWILVLGDAFIFVLLFVSYLAYRSQDVAVYNASQALLNPHFGALNTLLLLASSWFVVSALNALRRERSTLSLRFFQLAWFSGFCFGVVKIVEYGAKFQEGITPLTNTFFMFYFVLTGIHFVHLLIGLGVLAFMIRITKRSAPGNRRINTLECGATYWHLVDLLWIVLFPLIYLVR